MARLAVPSGYQAFSTCTKLTSITIPNSVIEIDDSAFSNCTSLTSVTIPNSLTTIKTSVFLNCTGLTSVIIPDSVTSIIVGAFRNCSNLTDVYYSGAKEKWNQISIDFAFNWTLTGARIHYNSTGPHTHDYQAVVTLANCTEQGYITYTCECGNSYIDNYVDALGHKYEVKSVTEPTCTERGYTTYECSVCEKTTTSDYLEETGHSVDSMEITKEPTCDTKGTMTGVCSICNEEVTESISSLGHDYGELKINLEATCTTAGQMSQTCSRCQSRINIKTIPATGHTLTEWEQVDDASCGAYGRFECVCITCGQLLIMNAPSDKHNYSIEGNIVPATCTTDGSKTIECSGCGKTITETIPATGHNYETVVTAPTCTESGLTEGVKCSECDEIIVEQEVVSALGHAPANPVEENYVAPTCTENGSKDVVVYCSVCDEEISRGTETIEATGHADKDGDGYCDADNKLLDPSVECECNCHKTGISKFFFNLILFFQRLFGSNQVCDCGVAHY